ncbi:MULTISPECIES: XRE family transcriptional regulator [Streptomycetaceae]|uniref:XRE family transcriptional regulator n=1 Tax=Streptomycetaceae TaxID=2062 RepID=UPI00093D1A63|nr:XRE family transcriptional regulator [Streptomyces sp. CB02056]OKI07517.1 XRE family transcriptional regulator [Streptomyces sp. CB02056]
MTSRSWTEVWAEAQRINPWLASPEAEADRARIRKENLARIRGYELAEMRKSADLTQKEVAALMGVSQARVSQIEHGQVDSLDNLRAYSAAIGGEVEVMIRRGERTIKVA